MWRFAWQKSGKTAQKSRFDVILATWQVAARFSQPSYGRYTVWPYIFIVQKTERDPESSRMLSAFSTSLKHQFRRIFEIPIHVRDRDHGAKIGDAG